MSFTLIKPLKFYLHYTPDKIHAYLLSQLGGHLMNGQKITSRLDFLEGKRIQLTIKDTENCWRFIVHKNRLLDDMKSKTVSDVHIQGNLKTFLSLATGKEDPDSLFFSRDLSLEGNTEDGLYIKNLIDAMDFDTNIYLKSILGKKSVKRIRSLLEKI